MIQYITRFDGSCIVKSEDSSKTMIAEVLTFTEKKQLTVSIAKSVKVSLTWNGRVYEGHMAGLSLVSDGPKKITSTTGR